MKQIIIFCFGDLENQEIYNTIILIDYLILLFSIYSSSHQPIWEKGKGK